MSALHISKTFRANLPENMGEPYALAVSGGGDSMALCHLFREAFPQAKLYALHFDHGLRPGSEKEARWLQEALAPLNIEVITERWQDRSEGPGNLQQAARRARYAFFAKRSDRLGAAGVFTAHNADDVAETFLMRLGKGSGLKGLAALPAQSRVAGVTVWRPLLALGREELRAWLRQGAVQWLEDPSNEDEKFLRIKIRKSKQWLEDIGINFKSITASAQALARAEAVVAQLAEQAFARHVRVETEGVFIKTTALEEPEEISLRMLEMAILVVMPAPLAPRTSKRQRLRRALLAGKAASLGGVRFEPLDGGFLLTPERRP